MKAHVQEVLSSLKGIETAKLTVTPEGLIPIAVKRGEITAVENEVIREAQMLLDEYGKSSPDVYEFIKRPLKTFPTPYGLGVAKGTLRQMSIECEDVVGVLKSLVTPISPRDVDRLDQLRREIEDVTIDINYMRNLGEAIKEYENGHFLASTLITSRVIVYTLDQIEGGTDEEKIKFLQGKNVIPNDRKDVKEFIIKAGKKARNFFSHDMRIFAEPSDALGLLGDSVKLLGILSKLQSISA
jgi:hypothetical protein